MKTPVPHPGSNSIHIISDRQTPGRREGRRPAVLWLAVWLFACAWLPSARAQILVVDGNLNAGQGGVSAFAQGANGNVLPDMTLAGASTGINLVQGLAANATHLYVLCNNFVELPFVLKYSLPTSGNATPVSKTYLASAAGPLDFPNALAIDGTNVYVLDNGTGVGAALGAVHVFPLSSLTSNAVGSPLAAIRTLTGASTGLSRPTGLTVDGTSIYVANTLANNLLIFALAAGGNVAPGKTITGLSGPVGVAVDATTLYALNGASGTVTTYALSGLGGGGAVAPTTTIGSTAITSGATYLGVDATSLYVGDAGDIFGTPVPSVLVFPKATNSLTATPGATLAGTTALTGVNGLFVLDPPVTAAPTVTASGGSTAFTIGGGAVAVDNGVSLTAVPATLATATIQIAGGFQTAEDVLAFTNNNATTFGNIAGTYNATLGILRLVSDGATATTAQWQAALRAVTYNDTAGSPNTGNRTIACKVFDGAQTSTNATKTLTLGVAPSVTTTVAASAASATFSASNQTIALSATVTSTGGTVTAGTVTFTVKSGATVIGSPVTSAAITAGAATASYTLPGGTAAGTYTIEAVYNASGLFATSTDSTRALSVFATPIITSVTAPSAGTYKAGDVLTFTVNPSTAVTVTGVPSLALTIGSNPRTATYVASASTATALVFRYTVALGDNAASGIALTSPIALNSGTIVGAGSLAATLTFTAPSLSSVLVDTLPVLSASGGSVAFTSADNAAATPVAVDVGITVSDPSSATLFYALVTIAGNFESDADVLSFTNDGATMGDITAAPFGGSVFGSSTLALFAPSGAATLSEWQAALRAVKYTSTSSNPSTATRTITFKVNDSVQDSNAVTRTLTVAAVNQTPVVTPSAGATSFAPGGGPVPVDAAVLVADGNNTTLSTATISITNPPAQDSLSFTPNPATMGNIVVLGPFSSIDGILSLISPDASATLDQWTAALRAVTYNNSNSTTPLTGDREITFYVNDGALPSAAGVKTLTVRQPTPTVLSVAAPSAGTYKAGDVLNFSLTFNQVVNVTGTPSFSVTIGSKSRTATYVSGSGTSTLTFRYTVVLGDNALAGIVVASPLALNNGGAIKSAGNVNATLAFTPPATTTVVVSTAPILTLSGGATAFVSGNNTVSTPVAVDSGLTLTDTSLSALPANGGAIVTIAGNFEAATDVLSFANTSTEAYGDITAIFTEVPVFSVPAGSLILASTSGTPTIAQWQAALRAIKFTSTAPIPTTANRTITFTVSDGTQNGSVVSKTVTVTATNQSPRILTSSGKATFALGGSAVVVDGGLSISDLDNTTLARGLVTITDFQAGAEFVALTADPATMGNITPTYATIDGVATLVLTSAGSTATLAQWEAALRAVTYFANATVAPIDRVINFKVDDGIGVGPSDWKAVQVRRAPTIAWTPTAIVYGTPLGTAQQTATATFNGDTLPGNFAFSPVAGTVLSAGDQSVSLTFTPTDAATYAIMTVTRTLAVSVAPTTTTATPASATLTATNQTVTLRAAVTSATATVNAGSVTFTVLDAKKAAIGTPVSGNVSAGQATASYVLPGGTPAGSYTLKASYTAAGSFASSEDQTQVFSVGRAATTIATAGVFNALGTILSATVTSTAGTVNDGTVTFTLKNSSGATVGTPVTSGTVSSGVAFVFYDAPYGTDGGIYTIQATYNSPTGGSFATSTDSSKTVTTTIATRVSVSGDYRGKIRSAVFASGLPSNSNSRLAIDRNGNVYRSNPQQGTITKFTSTGTASTLVTGLNNPTRLVSDSAGNLYVATDAGGGAMYKVTPDGTSSRFASLNALGSNLRDLKFDPQGVLSYTAFGRVVGAGNELGFNLFKLSSAGVLSNVTPRLDSVSGYLRTGAFGWDSSRNLNIAVSSDTGDDIFRGPGINGFNATTGEKARRSAYGIPVQSDLVFDAKGNLFISDPFSGTIYQIDFNGTKTQYFSTNEANGGIALDSDGNIYVSGRDRITRIGQGGFVKLAASLTSTAGAISTGTVTFSMLDGDTVLGTPMTVALKANKAEVEYSIPGGVAASSYTIKAVYNPATGSILASSISTDTLKTTEALRKQIMFGLFGSAKAAGRSLTSSRRAAAEPGSNLAVVINPGGSTGQLVGYIGSISAGFSVDIAIADDDTFTGQTKALTSSTGTGQTLTFSGSIADGVMTGTVAELGLSFTAQVDPATGSSSAVAGLYQASGSGAATYSIIGSQGQVFVLALTPTGVAAGTGTLASDNTYTVQTSQGTSVAGTINATTTTTTATITLPNGGGTIGVSGVSAETPAVNQLANLSALGTVGPNQVLIDGFVISGSGPKNILVRAVGPGLAPMGVSGPLATPTLRILDVTGQTLLSNSGWADDAALSAAFSQVGAFPLAAGSRDAAVLATLQPGVYFVHVTGGGASGQALTELYDLDPVGSPLHGRLVNEATRDSVSGTSKVMLAGFVIYGNTPQKVLIRGIGPGLSQQGVSGALATPVLTLRDAQQTLIAQNQAWGTPLAVTGGQTPATATEIASAASNVGAFALAAGSSDTAVLVVLPAGVYTAQLAGANNASGAAMIEIYVVE